MTAPRATYRLQFSAAFGFADAARLAPYLARLGVSHVYASPIFAARPGSTHGYDVTDPCRLNPELGSEADFRTMVEAFRAEGLGLLLDIVPNHMGIGGEANLYWEDVLAWGPASRYAPWFDIDWASSYPGLAGKVLVPFLGDQYGAVLAAGELRLERDARGLAVRAHASHRLPVCPAHWHRVLAEAPALGELAARAAAAEGPPGAPVWAELSAALAQTPDAALEPALAAFRGRAGELASWARLDALIADQYWRAAKFSLDGEAINYRRFFTISELAGVRVEDEAVFEATHGLILHLVEEGLVDGLRVDHIDGLRDPRGYCRRLRARARPPIWLLVEKILAPDERLPADWAADGTTGYEVANLLVGLLTDPAGRATLDGLYGRFAGRTEPPAAVVRRAKREVMAGAMAAETEGLVRRLHALAAADPATRDIGPHALRRAVVATVAALGVYRTYAGPDGIDPGDRARVAAAIAAARQDERELDPAVLDFLERALTLGLGTGEAALEVLARAQQLTGPVMAKGLEDRALYRFNRLIALNEVGSEPGRYGVTVAEFHAANAERHAREPLALLTTSTHDTKRGEDARLRIAALAGRTEAWAAAVERWRAALPEAEAVDPNEVYFLFQLLLGAWPAEWRDAPPPAALATFAERVEAAMLKSAREAAVNTRWTFGDPDYEAALARLVRAALAPGAGNAFLGDFRAFEATVAADGAALALVQTVLRLTIPGVPDVYQGAELWEQSLVDPDNRRPVDFSARAALLDRGRAAAASDPWSGEAKLAAIAALLGARRERPALFAEGDYRPLAIAGAAPEDVVAFERRLGEARLVVAAALRPARPPGPGVRTEAEGEGPWRSLLDGREIGRLEEAPLFEDLPATALLR